MRIWTKTTGEPWAITGNALQTILDIANRTNESPSAVAAKLGKELNHAYKVEERDGIAILPVTGPLFRYANLFTQVSSASSYELLARDFNTALENPDIHTILLNIDSPGGEVNGCAEFANMIYAARGKKPIIAYASGDACSGAYWIASAADRIVVSETSALGSIGVVAVFQKNKGDSIEIVSTQSPYKRNDPEAEEGKARLQSRIDSVADVFVEAVARNRDTSKEHVTNKFGQGDVFIGKEAVQHGLADSIGSFEQLIHHHTKPKEDVMDNAIETINEPTAQEEVTIDYRAEERARIKAIINAKEAEHRTDLAKHLAFESNLSAEEALNLLSKSPTAHKQNDLELAMQQVANPKIVPATEDQEESEEQIAKRIAAY